MNKKKKNNTKNDIETSIKNRIDTFLFKMDYPEQVTNQTPAFIKKKILPLFKRTESSLTMIDTETFMNVLEDQMAKEPTPIKMIKYMSFMQESVSYFDRIFFNHKENNL